MWFTFECVETLYKSFFFIFFVRILGLFRESKQHLLGSMTYVKRAKLLTRLIEYSIGKEVRTR